MTVDLIDLPLGYGGGFGGGFGPLGSAALEIPVEELPPVVQEASPVADRDQDVRPRRPVYLVETEDLYCDGQRVAPRVIGES